MAKKSIKRTILVDTNIFIEVFKQNTTIINAYAKIGESNVAINPIIKTELYRGAQNKNDN